MADFSELIKRLDRIRPLVRNFYIFGYRTRGEYGEKSGRSYDNERRRIESWLGSLIRQERSPAGKNVFISVDVSNQPRNPLYAVWKAKTFTRNDILLHFFVLDLLSDGVPRAAEQVVDALAERHDELFELPTVRLKLREYARLGLLNMSKSGKRSLYALSSDRFSDLLEGEAGRRLLAAVDFFTEMLPFGEVGSHLQDSIGHVNSLFSFKHHFLVHTLENEILLLLLQAIEQKRAVILSMPGNRKQIGTPLKILVSLQSGRRYVCILQSGKHLTRRLDRIDGVELADPDPEFGERKKDLEALLPGAWGVGAFPKQERLEMLLYIDECRERFVLDRLMREGRGGRIERVSENVFRYTRDAADSNEMLPFVKSFTGRILSLRGSWRATERKFRRDMERMAEMYGIKRLPEEMLAPQELS